MHLAATVVVPERIAIIPAVAQVAVTQVAEPLTTAADIPVAAEVLITLASYYKRKPGLEADMDW
jgi:hypothetical protein